MPTSSAISASQMTQTPDRQREGTVVNSERSSHLTDQRFAELRALADSLGLVVSMRCQYCGAPLWAAASLTAGAGPICRRKHENGPGAHPAKNARPEAA